MSPGGKLIALVCHPTKKVNKAEELNYLSTDIQYIARCSVAIQGKEGGRQVLAGVGRCWQVLAGVGRCWQGQLHLAKQQDLSLE